MARLCIFGDSISLGIYDPQNGGWCNLLKLAWLQKSQFNQVYDLSISGINSNSILERIEIEGSRRLTPKREQGNSIIIAIGLNDCKLIENKTSFVSKEKYRNNLLRIIDLSMKMVKDVFLLGLTPVDELRTNPVSWNKLEFYNNGQVEEYNQTLKGVSLEKNVTFINIFSTWKKLDYTKLLHDGLHPNSEGHKEIYAQVLRCIRKKHLI
ncbi:MAG: GDSL-type esterase/lipase family protein [Patescibacteria group bacterium]|nr:hypothetical protein [Patescibacteria group bacterium]